VARNQPSNPWFDDECKIAKRLAHDAAETAAFDQLKSEYHRITQQKKRQYQSAKYSEIESLYSRNQTDFWKLLKSLANKRQSCPIELDEFLENLKQDHSFAPSPADPEVDRFVSTYFNSGCLPTGFVERFKNILDRPIDKAELHRAAQRQKSGKSCGSDGIPTYVLKCFMQSSNVLLDVFNYVLDAEDYPTRWIEGMITPILKPGKPPSETSSYRKVTVLPNVGTLFETVLENRLEEVESTAGTSDPLNIGFSSGFRPADNLIVVDCVIRRYRFLKRPLFVALVDLREAFDKILRSGLFYKMGAQGFGSKALKVLYSMYQKSRSGFRLNGKFTATVRTILGVNQGSVLSPRLFKKFFQDMRKYLTAPGAWIDGFELIYLLFADDNVLFATSADDLQLQLNNLYNYCEEWHVIINTSKTKVMVFDAVRGRKRLTVTPTFAINGSPVEIVDEALYLGVKLNSRFENHFKTHVDHVIGKSYKALFTIYSLCRNVGSLPPRTAFKLFDSLVVSVMAYGIEVWYSDVACKRLEMLHKNFIRYVLGVRRSTPLLALYGETGRFPLQLKFSAAVVKYANTLSRRDCLSQQSPLHAVRLHLSNRVNTGIPSWLDVILKASDPQTVRDVVGGELSFNQWRFDQCELWHQDWKVQIQSDTHKLSTYKSFKHSLGMEEYLVSVPNVRHRKAICRFRVSSHNFAVEKLRYNRTPREQRLCRYCQPADNVVEDELHVLLVCPAYYAARTALFDLIGTRVLRPVPVAQVFVDLLTSSDVDVLRALSCFVHHAVVTHASV
jgi:hypothetical protein